MNAHALGAKLHEAKIEIPDPGSAGTIYVNESLAVCNLVSAGAETRTLGRPTKPGDIVTLHMRTDGGDITLTVTGGFNEDGDTTFTFSDVGQFVTFQAFLAADGTTYFWRKLTDYGLGNIAPGDSAVLDELSGLTATVAELNAAADVSARRIAIADGNYSILAANSGKPHIIADVTADRTYSFPAEADGLDFEFFPDLNAADGHDWIFDTGSNTNFFTGGVVHLDTDANDAGDEVVLVAPDGNSNSKLQINLPAPGTRIRFICNGTTWTVSGIVVSAEAPAFADQ